MSDENNLNEVTFQDDELEALSEDLPESLPLLVVKERPLFPGITHPIIYTGKKHFDMLNEVIDEESPYIGLVLQMDDAENQEIEDLKIDQLAKVGVVCKVLQMKQADNGACHLLISTLERFEIEEVDNDKYPFNAKVNYWGVEHYEETKQTKAYSVALINAIRELVRLNPLFKEELTLLIGKKGVERPGVLADFSALMTTASKKELQELLETRSIYERMELALVLLKKELEISKAKNTINRRIEARVNKQQQEFFLRQQLQEIKKELGIVKDDKEIEETKIKKKLKGKKLSKEVKERIEEENDKLQMLEPSSPEYHLTKNYLDWLVDLPWGVHDKINANLTKATKILDEKHYAMDDVKERVLEYLAVVKKRKGHHGNIILLLGPPGVGKTSIGKSIAECLGQKFYRFSLGGMRDEAEIKGHRRTYVGSMPGKIIQALKTVKTSNPVIMLDEIDKISHSQFGDPSSALLEVLDPEQNKDFLDHFIDVRYDLSKVLFICTANQIDSIPAPLLDRMEIIELSGYITEEKIEMTKRHLLPKLLENTGLKKTEFSISDKVIKQIIEDYARESGVRTLEKVLNKILRKVTFELTKNRSLKKIDLTSKKVEEYLGKARFTKDDGPSEQVGVVNGLAYTSIGGSTLQIEATKTPSKDAGLKQTGQLGKVMIESSEIAYTHVKCLLKKTKTFNSNMFHLHVPAGATPKDGPSAGITMATAMVSLAKNKAVKKGVAMTGELTLTGKVMPIGGLKEKLLAAKRAGMKEVIVPYGNKKDYTELPKSVKKGIQMHFVRSFDDVLKICF